ncbi:MAG: hypothetical protein AAGD25_21545 [Cyanobacteria bacterium P01_F01_bin.150]
MKVTPLMSKLCSFVCTTLFSLSLLLAPTAPAWAFADISLGTSTEMLATTNTLVADAALSDSEIDNLVGDLEKPSDDETVEKPAAASSGNIQLNTSCLGVTATGTYLGRWKKLGPNKAKCKEGAGGQPGGFITRSICRIVTINDGNFDNADVFSPNKCMT